MVSRIPVQIETPVVRVQDTWEFLDCPEGLPGADQAPARGCEECTGVGLTGLALGLMIAILAVLVARVLER